MSAIKDPTQNTTFIYSNFYQIYRKGKMQSQQQQELAKGIVLKSHSVIETPAVAEVRVVSSKQTEELSQWAGNASEGKKDMAAHLRTLRDARKRLNFLMNEMEELLKRS